MGSSRHSGVGTRLIARMAPHVEANNLAVEVISPNDVWEKVRSKIRDYFNAGVRQVWLISLEHREIYVYDSPTRINVLTEEDELTSEELLPGFRCRISDLFKQPARA